MTLCGEKDALVELIISYSSQTPLSLVPGLVPRAAGRLKICIQALDHYQTHWHAGQEDFPCRRLIKDKSICIANRLSILLAS